MKLHCHLKKSLPFVSKGTMDTWKNTLSREFFPSEDIESIPIAVVIKCFSVLVALIYEAWDDEIPLGGDQCLLLSVMWVC